MGGVPRCTVARAVRRYASATDSAMRRTSLPIAARVSGVVARSVPVSTARSGMMFGRRPRMNGANRHDGRGGRIDASSDDGLQRRDERRRADDGIGGFVRPRTVCSFADQLDLERVGGCGERSRVRDDLSDREPTIDVSAEDGLHVVERAGVENGLRAFAQLPRPAAARRARRRRPDCARAAARRRSPTCCECRGRTRA